MSGVRTGSDAEFEEFANSGSVEVGESNLASQRGASDDGNSDDSSGESDDDDQSKGGNQSTTGDGAGDDGQGDDDGNEGGDDDDQGKKSKTPESVRIRNLTRRLREAERARKADREELLAAINSLRNGGLSSNQGGGNSDDIGPAPDPTDTAKYPLGHLDEKFVKDSIRHEALRAAADTAKSVLQRQQENERQQQAERHQAALLEKVDNLAAKGSEIHDDYQETVVDSAMRGDWALSQPTFEAAYDADHGAEILYNLSQDKKEAERVAALTPYQQLKYVLEKDAEISAAKKSKKIPKAGEPPQTQTRGANSRTQINPATDNLDEFEKLWESGAKK
jgi:hypothetical protein